MLSWEIEAKWPPAGGKGEVVASGSGASMGF